MVHQMPCIKRTTKPDTKPSLECPICLEVVSSAVTTQCGHSFCFHCLFLSTIAQCPMCRHPPGLSALTVREYAEVARQLWTRNLDAPSSPPNPTATPFPHDDFSALVMFSSDFEHDELLQLRARIAKLTTTTKFSAPHASPHRPSSLLKKEPEEYLVPYRKEMVEGFLNAPASGKSPHHYWGPLVRGCVDGDPSSLKMFAKAVEKALREYESVQGRLVRVRMGRSLSHFHAYDENSQQQMFFDGGLMWRRAPSLVLRKVDPISSPADNVLESSANRPVIQSSRCNGSKPPLQPPTSRRDSDGNQCKHRHHLSPIPAATNQRSSRLTGHLAHLLQLSMEGGKGEKDDALRDPFGDDDEDETVQPSTPRSGSGCGGVQLVTPRGKQWTCAPLAPSTHAMPPLSGRSTLQRHSAPVVAHIPTTSLLTRPVSAALNQQDDDLFTVTRQLAKLRSRVAHRAGYLSLPQPNGGTKTITKKSRK